MPLYSDNTDDRDTGLLGDLVLMGPMTSIHLWFLTMCGML